TAKVTVNGTDYTVEWEKPVEEKPVVKVQPVAAKPAAPATPAAKPAAAPVSGNAIKTPLPGVIIDVKVAVGDVVKKGQTVVVLEAMKMENNINADRDGKVVAIQVAKGDTVADGAVLVVLE
ncbi:MAG: acetyl-CoA carboxylase biotin carboxyl carrier protein subunit, partial [Bacteroidaceae bacterium]|nr:acetyl-CoA carboxylase biotin carboxyl carrier protein subunit [Bacteroidaceae bacterium]